MTEYPFELTVAPLVALGLLCYRRARRGALPWLEFVLIWFTVTVIAGLPWRMLSAVGPFVAAALAAGFPLFVAALAGWFGGRRAWPNHVVGMVAFALGFLPALAFPGVALAFICILTGDCL